MTKFLKKYRNTILIFFGVFIVIVFVGQQWITNLGQGARNRTEYRVNGRPVLTQELMQFTLRHTEFDRLLDSQVAGLLGAYSEPRGGQLLTSEFMDIQRRAFELQSKSRPTDGKPPQTLTAAETFELNIGLRRRQQNLLADAERLTALEPKTPTGAFRSMLGITSPTHLQLLVEEAREAGMVGNTADPLEFGTLLAEFLAARAWGPDWRFAPTDSAVNELTEPRERRVALWANLLGSAAQQALSIGTVQQQAVRASLADAVAETAGVLRLMALHAQSARPSRQRVAADLRRTLDRVSVSHYLLSVDNDRAKAQPEPTPEEVAAHLEKFKDVFPPNSRETAELRARGALDTRALPFGYKLSDRVKLKHLTLDVADLAKQITRESIETLVQSAVVSRTDVGTDAAKLAEAEAAAEDRIRWEIVRDVRQAVEREVLSARGAAEAGRPVELPTLAARATDAGAAAARASMRKALAGKEPPADFKPSPRIEVVQPSGWLSVNSLGTSETWQFAAIIVDPATRRIVRMADLLDAVPAFGRANPARAIKMGLPLAEPVSAFGPAATDLSRPDRLHFVVFTEAAVASAPTLDDRLDSGKTVREQIVEDLKRYKEFKGLADVAAQFAQTAGLFEFSTLAVQMQPMGINATMVENVEVSRSPRLLNPPFFARGTDFIEQVMTRAEALDFGLPIFEMKVEDRTFAVNLQPLLAVALVQISEFRPFYDEQLANPADSARPPSADYVGRFGAVQGAGRMGAVGSLSYQALRRRLNATDLRETDESTPQ